MKVRTSLARGAAATAAAALSFGALGAVSAHADDTPSAADPAGSRAALVSTTVNFEITDEPCAFAQVNPLRNRYQGLGIHFRGPTPLDGAAILNECSNFGADARSGEAFLAVNNAVTLANGGLARGPVKIRFDERVRSASIWVSSGTPGSPETFKLTGKRGPHVVASDQVTTSVEDYQFLHVRSRDGLKSVTLRAVTTNGQWVADDLTVAGP